MKSAVEGDVAVEGECGGGRVVRGGNAVVMGGIRGGDVAVEGDQSEKCGSEGGTEGGCGGGTGFRRGNAVMKGGLDGGMQR